LCYPQKPTAEALRVDVVDERALAVDFDHRQPLAITRLELVVAGDVDLAKLEPKFLLVFGERRARPLAEVAALCRVKEDVLHAEGTA
jgi:hypothetical protein